MNELAKIIRSLLLAQRERRRYPTDDNLLAVKRLERQTVDKVKQILNINELTDEPKN